MLSGESQHIWCGDNLCSCPEEHHRQLFRKEDYDASSIETDTAMPDTSACAATAAKQQRIRSLTDPLPYAESKDKEIEFRFHPPEMTKTSPDSNRISRECATTACEEFIGEKQKKKKKKSKKERKRRKKSKHKFPKASCHSEVDYIFALETQRVPSPTPPDYDPFALDIFEGILDLRIDEGNEK